MAKKRTRKDKQKTSLRRLYQITLPDEFSPKSVAPAKKLFQTGLGIQAIKKDLFKTVSLAAFIITLEFVLYFYTR